MSIEVRLAGGMVNNSEDRYVALGDLYIVSDMLRSNSGGANNKPKHVNTPAGHRNRLLDCDRSREVREHKRAKLLGEYRAQEAEAKSAAAAEKLRSTRAAGDANRSAKRDALKDGMDVAGYGFQTFLLAGGEAVDEGFGEGFSVKQAKYMADHVENEVLLRLEVEGTADAGGVGSA